MGHTLASPVMFTAREARLHLLGEVTNVSSAPAAWQRIEAQRVMDARLHAYATNSRFNSSITFGNSAPKS